MKTKKVKGFTLVELIVVIAIIGVLAAILVPSMLGYVKKSKVSSANSAANSVQKAINTALVELDEEGKDIGDIKTIHYNGADLSVNKWVEDDNTSFLTKITNYMDDMEGLKFEAACDGGVCKAAAVAVDSTYTGTYPGGCITVDNYKKFSTSNPDSTIAVKINDTEVTETGLDGAIKAAMAKADMEISE